MQRDDEASEAPEAPDIPLRLKLASDFVCAAIAVLLSTPDQASQKEREYIEKFLRSLADAIYNGNIGSKPSSGLH